MDLLLPRIQHVVSDVLSDVECDENAFIEIYTTKEGVRAAVVFRSGLIPTEALEKYLEEGDFEGVHEAALNLAVGAKVKFYMVAEGSGERMRKAQ